MTPLGHKEFLPTYRRGPGGPTRRECWFAASLCGTWHYERIESRGTPWEVTHVPTGMREAFTSLPSARRWTASPHAINFLAARIQRVIDSDGNRPLIGGPIEDDNRPAAERYAHALALRASLNT